MRNKAFLIVTLLLTALLQNIYSQTYVLDKKVSEQINWKGYSEVGGYTQEGTITIKSSKLILSKEGELSGEIIINMRSI